MNTSFPSAYSPKITLVTLAILFLITARLLAQSVWTNNAAGAWGTAANWSPNGIPNAVDAVVTTSNAVVVTTNVNGRIVAESTL